MDIPKTLVFHTLQAKLGNTAPYKLRVKQI